VLVACSSLRARASRLVRQAAMPSAGSQSLGADRSGSGPLNGLRCLVCGMDDGKPTEQLVRSLGGKIYVVDPLLQTLPDVVVSDRAAAHRLQVRRIELYSRTH
jgi:hypothetical protein